MLLKNGTMILVENRHLHDHQYKDFSRARNFANAWDPMSTLNMAVLCDILIIPCMSRGQSFLSGLCKDSTGRLKKGCFYYVGCAQIRWLETSLTRDLHVVRVL